MTIHEASLPTQPVTVSIMVISLTCQLGISSGNCPGAADLRSAINSSPISNSSGLTSSAMVTLRRVRRTVRSRSVPGLFPSIQKIYTRCSVVERMEEKLENFGSKKGSVRKNTASTFREKLPLLLFALLQRISVGITQCCVRSLCTSPKWYGCFSKGFH